MTHANAHDHDQHDHDQHDHDQDQGVRGMWRYMRRVLCVGGRVVLVDEDFDDPTHPLYDQFQQRRASHHHTFDDINVETVAALMSSAGFSSASGELSSVAGRPVKLVRGLK